MGKWTEIRKGGNFAELAGELGLSPLTIRLLRNRDLTTREQIEAYLYGTIDSLYDPHLLPDADRAAAILTAAVQEGKQIRIIGDYDVDGICATFILERGLTLLGAKVDHVLPDRVRDGYGLNENLIRQAAEAGVDLILTCDNGIAAAAEIRLAKELGLQVVVTDHHEVPEAGCPAADAVVDPKRDDSKYPFPEICGAVVAWKLLQLLPGLDALHHVELLEASALATVCDVMNLVQENRTIVREGLRQLNHTNSPGLRALIHLNGLDEKDLTAYHLGFVLGPCLNASGRLDSAERGCRLLLCDNPAEAARLAADLTALNEERKNIQQQGLEQAQAELDGMETLPDILVVCIPECRESVVGIIAGKIREKYGHPTLVLTRSEAEPGILKGSGRSIPAYDMYEGLCGCSELFTKFGGHKMAAGMSLKEENLEALRQQLNAESHLQPEDFIETGRLDAVVPVSACSMPLVRELELLEPFGNGNTKPCFGARGVNVLSGRIFGARKNVAKYRIQDETGRNLEMILFGPDRIEGFHTMLAERFGKPALERMLGNGVRPGDMEISLVYQPQINSYQGTESLQLLMEDYL